LWICKRAGRGTNGPQVSLRLAIAYGVPHCLTEKQRGFVRGLGSDRVGKAQFTIWVDLRSGCKTNNRVVRIGGFIAKQAFIVVAF